MPRLALISRHLLLLLVAVTVAACSAPTTRRTPLDDQRVQQEQAKQRDLAVAYSARLHERLYRVSYPLLTAATPLCPERLKPGTGMLLVSEYDFAPEMRAAAKRVFGVTKRLRVHQVLTDAPADRAGLERGDYLMAVDGHQIGTGEDEEKRLNTFLKGTEPTAPRQFTVRRDGQPLTLTLEPEARCDYGLAVAGSDSVNAVADGDNIILTKGMMRFAETDRELALVVAHELAHNTGKHVEARRSNATGGLLLDILAAAAGVNTQGTFSNLAANAYSQEFEAEADYVGMYIMARAGLPLDGAADFWRRMAAEHPASIARNHSSSHPASAERFIGLEQTVREIDGKRSAGTALLPEYQAEKR